MVLPITTKLNVIVQIITVYHYLQWNLMSVVMI